MEGFDYSVVEYNGLARNKSNPDDSLIVIFSQEAVKNEELSNQHGFPHYDPVEFIKICAPGERDPLAFRPISEKDKQRFRPRYEAWKAGRQVASSGYPLEQWPPVDKAMLATLKASNIFTVQDVANVSDSNIRSLGLYGIKLRKQAQDFLVQAEGGAPLIALRAELEDFKSRYNSLVDQNNRLLEKLKEMGVPTIEGRTYLPQIQPSVSHQGINSLVEEAVKKALAAALSKSTSQETPQEESHKKRGRPKKNLSGEAI